MKRPTIHDVPVRYCSQCGTKLENKEVHSRYDTETGKPLSRIISVCPRRRWYNSHDKIIRHYRYSLKGKIEWIE